MIGSDACPAGAVIVLGAAEGQTLTLRNALDLNGNDATVYGRGSGTVRIEDALANSAATAAGLAVEGGEVTLAGQVACGAGAVTVTPQNGGSVVFADLEIDLANPGTTLAVDGDVAVAAGSAVTLTSDRAALRALEVDGQTLVIATADDDITGAFEKETNLPGWRVRTAGNEVTVCYRNPGTGVQSNF